MALYSCIRYVSRTQNITEIPLWRDSAPDPAGDLTAPIGPLTGFRGNFAGKRGGELVKGKKERRRTGGEESRSGE